MKKSIGAGTLLVPTPTWVVGTYDATGRANAATIAWGGICCSKPPCVAVSLRSATMTHGNIMARKVFTVNIPSQDQIAQADYMGMASGRDADKFAVTGLTSAKSEFVDAPYVADFPVVIACTVLQVVEIGLHTQFIGEIKDILADPAALDAQGRLDIAAVRPVVYAPGTRTYHAVVGEPLAQGFNVGRGYMKEPG